MNRLTVLLLCATLGHATVSHAQQGGDLEARILYAFHAEDLNELSSIAQTLSTAEQGGSADATLRYHLAHADYRLGLLRESRGHNADDSFDACIDELKPNLQSTVNSAENLALQGACYSGLARSRKLERLLLRSRASERLDSAAKLEPRNPRVLYLTASEELVRFKLGTQENQRAFGELELSAKLFEKASATSADAPAWGHAESYLAMSRQCTARGEMVSARDWIEKSLLVAPDFKAAQRQLAMVLHR